MIATLLVGMLCVYLLSFTVMFLLIGRRLGDGPMGMDAFAVGNLSLGLAYVLQLLEGPPGLGVVSVLNHALTLCSILAYCVGGARFFGRPLPLWRPLLLLALGHVLVQLLVEGLWGPVARYVLLAALCALSFAGMVLVLLWGLRSFARDLRAEMLLFVVLISGICVLNVIKLGKLLSAGFAGLDMDTGFQMVFYVYMCSLATILPPAAVWLVLRRLTDTLRALAAHDPLTQLLNRRGLDQALVALFRRPPVQASLLLVDVDYFKQINDNHGHHVGDVVLCAVADTLRTTVRHGDLVCRLGGEEFAVIGMGADTAQALALAERIRAAVQAKVMLQGPAYDRLRCTVTVGVAHGLDSLAALDAVMREADEALYRGKQAGRNRVEAALGVQAPLSPACPG